MPDTQSSKGKTIKQFPEASELNDSDAFLLHGELEFKHITFGNFFTIIKDKICNIITIMTGATSDSNGKSGLVPEPASEDHNAFLRGDGIWGFPTKDDVGLGNVPNISTDDQTPTFSQAENRENIESEETLSTLFGKIKKWLSDLNIVAFSGEYGDLSNTPTIPIVNDATLTIQKNNEDVGTFSANQATDDIVNIIIPTKVSELENDSEFKTTDTWNANTKENEGYVEKGEGHANQVWGTDESGNPGWRDEKDTTYNTMVGATASSNGTSGLVPGANAGEEKKFLRGDGTWDTPSGTNESSLVNLIYPVGSIYMSVNSVNPSNLFAGTSWEAWGSGKVPVGVNSSETEFSTVEKTGGIKSVNLNHSHTVNSHSHTVNSHRHQVDSHSHTVNSHRHKVESHQHYVEPHSHTVNSHSHLGTFGWDESSYYCGMPYGYDVVNANGNGYAVSFSGYSKSTLVRLGYTGSSAPGTSTSAPNTSFSAPYTDYQSPGTNGAAPYTNYQSPGTSESSPGTDAKLGSAVNNLQPYITCYMWKRTA